MFLLKFNTIFGKIQALLATVGFIFLSLFLILVFYNAKQESEIIRSSQLHYEHEINSLFEMNSAFVEQAVSDYTYWDLFVNALDKNDTSWYSSNISFDSFNYDYVCIYNKKYELVHLSAKDSFPNIPIIPIESVYRLHQTRFAHFFLDSSVGFLEISAASVHPSNDPTHKNTDPAGYLYVVRKWDQKFIRKLSNISGSKVDLLSDSDTLPDNRNAIVKTIIPLPDWQDVNKHKIVFIRDININAKATHQIMFIILGYVFLALSFAYFIAKKCINKPLKLVTDILQTDNIQSINELKKSPSEYGRIGHLFEEYVTQKEELKNAKEKAEVSDRLKTAFLANMSHEIRTPMNHIVGFSGLIESENDEEKRNKYLQNIKLSSANLLNLINDLIDLSKIEAGDLVIKKSNFSVYEMFNELKDAFALELVKKNKNQVIFKYELTETDFIINSDPSRLKQILSNLLSNAIKFTAQGTITFSCYQGKNELIFSVTDTGTGIPLEDQKIIFDRFTKFDYQGMNTHGSGIGLSIVKRLVELLKGRIWFNSIVGIGTSFYFSIPAEYSVQAIKPIQISAILTGDQIQFPKNQKSILIVEDDKNSLFLIKEFLKPFNLNIQHVGDGDEAVEYIRVNPETKLVLMDIRLPSMGGHEATAEIRKFNTTIPIIAQTANAMLGDKEKALNSGCNDYITKPIDPNKLLSMVGKYLAN